MLPEAHVTSRPLKVVEGAASVPCFASMRLGSLARSPYKVKEKIMHAFRLCFVSMVASMRKGQHPTDESKAD